jgi:hypothetical protein
MSNVNSDVRSQDFLLQKFPSWTLLHWCVAVGAVSFLILALLPKARLTDLGVPFGGENVRVARSLAAHGTFADPFATLKTGTTAHVAPVYPFLYSWALRAFGTGYAALLILWAINLGFLAVQMALLPVLSHRLHLGVLPGIVAAALGSLSLFAPVDTQWESFFAGTLLLLICLMLERYFHGRHAFTAAAGLGIVWGILVLTNPITVLLLLVWPLCWVLAMPPGDRALSAKRFVVIVGAAMLTVAPWIARNYAQFGAFIFVRDNLGLELYTSNNPCAEATLLENIQSGCHARTHPNPSRAVAMELVSAGENPFNRSRLHEALVWIGANRQQFLSLTARRFRQFWLPDLAHVWETIEVWMITLISLVGILVMARKNPVSAWLMFTAWVFFPTIYYVVQSDPRYRYPIYWTSLLPAGCALAEAALRLPFLKAAPDHPTKQSPERSGIQEGRT